MFALSLVDPAADVAAEAAAFRPAFSHLALLLQIPGVDVARTHRGGEGRAARRRASERSSRSGSRRPARWLETFAPERARSRSSDDAAAEAARARPTTSARSCAALADAAAEDVPVGGDAWQAADLRRRHRRRPPGRAGVRRPLPRVPRSHRTGRGPAGCWPRSSRLRAPSAARGRRTPPGSGRPARRGR